MQGYADRLGGTLGNYNVAIRQKGKKFYVGGQKFSSIEEAGEAALRQAIEQGAIKGLRAGAQRLISSGRDLERQVSKAVDFQSVFDRLKEYDDPVGRGTRKA